MLEYKCKCHGEIISIIIRASAFTILQPSLKSTRSIVKHLYNHYEYVAWERMQSKSGLLISNYRFSPCSLQSYWVILTIVPHIPRSSSIMIIILLYTMQVFSSQLSTVTPFIPHHHQTSGTIVTANYSTCSFTLHNYNFT